MVGHVVLVAEHQHGHAAQGLQVLHERLRGPGGIHEDVASGAADQVAPGAEALLAGIAAEEDVPGQGMGKGPGGCGDSGLVLGADGAHRTGHQGHGSLQPRGLVARLGVNPRVITAIGEGVRGELVAGAAVDAGAVHEKGAWRVVGMGIRAVGHGDPPHAPSMSPGQGGCRLPKPAWSLVQRWSMTSLALKRTFGALAYLSSAAR